MSNALPNFMNIPYAFPSLSQTCPTTNNFNPSLYAGYNNTSDHLSSSIAALRLKAREYNVTFGSL
jgi:hypothetical protein